MGKTKTKPAADKPKRGSEKLRPLFEQFGLQYQDIDDAVVKQWVGELLVLAHRLDERIVQLESETWQHQRDEGVMIDLQAELVKARELAHRYRAQKINARRDFNEVRQDRDLIRAQHQALLATLGAAQVAYLQSEAEKSLAVTNGLTTVSHVVDPDESVTVSD